MSHVKGLKSTQLDELLKMADEIIEGDEGSSDNEQKIKEKWEDLQNAISGRKVELEKAREEAEAFTKEIQDQIKRNKSLFAVSTEQKTPPVFNSHQLCTDFP